MVSSLREPYRILLADDGDDDALLFGHALAKAAVPAEVIRARNGQEAIDYLSECLAPGTRATRKLPDILFLDLKMPLLDGFDVLKWLQPRRELDLLPVAVLSNSALPSGVEQVRALGADAYFVKPFEPSGLITVLRDLPEDFLHAEWKPASLIRDQYRLRKTLGLTSF
jgi:CheY-like chemotaxis protein